MNMKRLRAVRNENPSALRALAVLLSAACLVATLFCGTAMATGAPVNLTEKKSVTVLPSSKDYEDDIAKADVVMDLYKVADARAVDGYDAYTFDFGEGVYSHLTVTDDMTNDDWHELAQAAAQATFGGQQAATPDAAGKAGDKIDELDAGLYLLIARGENDTDNPVFDEQTRTYTSVARSELYEYTFSPELIALPTKAAQNVGIEGGEEQLVINTAQDYGDWIDDAVVQLKPSREHRMVDIVIQKTLQTYLEGEPATFVFEIEADYTEGEVTERVYSDVLALQFTAPGVQSSAPVRIQAGSDVTVTEVYSGSRYELVSPANGIVTLENIQVDGGDANIASFTNTFSGSGNGGHGIQNHFYDENGHWEVDRQIPGATQ